MVTEFFLQLMSDFVVWLASLFGTWTPPEELSTAVDVVSGVMSGIHGVGVWVEWGVIAACTATAVTTFLIVFGIRLILRIASHVPFVGGAG